MDSICITALYRFTALPQYANLQQPLLREMQRVSIKGTFLLAPEGINGTIAGDEKDIDALLTWLAEYPMLDGKLTDLDVKKSWSSTLPFARSKVKLKREIVTMGVTTIDPERDAGTYIDPKDWNQLISDPNVLLVDTRNEYEVQIGSFRNAVNPHTTTFREFPDYVRDHLDPTRDRKVAMFCTGGIRCEKSTAYLKSLGFEDVYHLRGGILKYLEETPEEESLWEGECFVFDERVAVDQNLEPGSFVQCHACRMPLSAEDAGSDLYIPGESCPHCHDSTSAEQKQRFRERERQSELAQQRGEPHQGDAVEHFRTQRKQAKLAQSKAQQEQKR